MNADVIVIAVKPQHVRAVARELATLLKRQVVLTIAAGIRLPDLSRWLLGYRRLVRAMPNTPALIGAGIAGLYALSGVDGDGRARAAAVLEAVGGTSVVRARGRTRRRHCGVRQRSGVRVLLHRGARIGGAANWVWSRPPRAGSRWPRSPVRRGWPSRAIPSPRCCARR